MATDDDKLMSQIDEVIVADRDSGTEMQLPATTLTHGEQITSGAPVGDSQTIRQIAKTKEDMTHGMAILEPRPQLGCETASKDTGTSGADDSRVR